MAESLAARGVEFYLPIRREVRKWSDRRKIVEVPVVPRFVFIRCEESDRVGILSGEPRIWRFLPFDGKAAVVRDVEMEAFRRMVEQGGKPVGFTDRPLAPGDRIRVDGTLGKVFAE